MTVSTAVPNGYNVTIGTWNAFSGSTALGIGSAVAVVTDSSNTTYVRGTAVSPNAAITYDLANVTTGGSSIYRTRSAVIVKNGDGQPGVLTLLMGGTNPSVSFFNNQTTASTVYGGWVTQSTAWSTADANAAQLRLVTYGTALRWTKAWMEYDLTSTPVGTPSVSSITTDRPTVTWTFSDGDGYLQSSAVVKVFSSAQYSAGGFDAGTSTSLWSGTVNGTASTITPSTAIVVSGDKYKPFLQVFKDISPTSINGAWTSATTVSTANFTPPNAPSLTATWSTANARVELTAVGSATPYRITVFRGTALTDPSYQLLSSGRYAGGTAQPRDYFVPRSSAIVYGAYVDSGTVTPFLQSAVTLATVTTGTVTTWELRSVDSPLTYSNLAVPVTGIAFEQYEGQTVYRPIGSNYPVVVAGNIGGDDGTMTITTTNQTVWDDIKEILDLQSDLYLVSPFVDSNNLARRWFIRVTGRSWIESGVPAAQVRTATVSFVEVAAPEVAAD
jgi:hypothetical protein